MYFRAVELLQSKLKIDAHYLFSGSFWMLSGHILTVASILITSYLFANYVDQDTYGIYKYLLTVGVIVSALSLTGLNSAVTQAAAKKIGKYFRYAEKTSLVYGIIPSSISTIGALYYFINDNWQLSTGLLIIAVLQPLMNSSNLIYAQLIGEQKFRILAKAHAVKIFITTFFISTGIFLSGNIFILIVLFFLGNILSNLVAKKLYYEPLSETLGVKNVLETKKITNYAKHLSVQNVLSTFTNQIDKVLIFQNLGAYELAVYSFATALPDQHKSLTKTIETMILPRFSQNTEQSVKDNMFNKTLIYFICLLLLCIIYILAVPHIFNFLYPEYIESVHLSQIYALGILFGISSLPIAGMKARMAKKKLHIFNIVTSIFQVVSLLILLPLLGLMGAVISRVLYRGVVALSAYTIYLYKAKV